MPEYNPLDKANLGVSVAEALLKKTPEPLDAIAQFDGAGIYAIYYTGPFPAYQAMARHNATAARWPIYIGKAIPPGGRRGGLGPVSGRPLWNRLREHADSIRATNNLNVADFLCRHLVVDDIWIPLGETLLIANLKPLWNTSLDGFGNHDPGAGRYNGLRPVWDVLHPGRDWAARCRVRTETQAELDQRMVDVLAATPPP